MTNTQISLNYSLKSLLLNIAVLFAATELYAQPPAISSFSPRAGAIGTTVTISGTGFYPVADSNIVYFGATRGTVTNATATDITVRVPQGATYQPISVTTRKLTAYSADPFTVTFPGSSVFTPASFARNMDIPMPGTPYSIVMSDFDGDGKPDLVTGNYMDASISILRNIGTGSISFAPRINYPSGGSPISVATGDFDGDGKTDIAVANSSSHNVSVYKNNSAPGNISFAAAIYISVGSTPLSIHVDDFDKDGKPDIATPNAMSSTVSILRNLSTGGSISFQARLDFPCGKEPYCLSTADFNADGKPDIVVANLSGASVSVLRNVSSNGISFTRQHDIPSPGRPFYSAAADFDGDGKPDFAVVSFINPGSVDIFRNKGTIDSISFDAKVRYPASHPEFIIPADLDGDGKPDLAVLNTTPDSSLSVYKNTGTNGVISFTPPVNYVIPADCFFMTIGDMDEDGKPDLAIVSGRNEMRVLKNSINAPAIISFSPGSATKGNTVTIKGANFTGTTAVTFGGTAATSFTVQSDSVIFAVVGTGNSGNINVTTPIGMATAAGFTYNLATAVVNIDAEHYIRFGPNPVKEHLLITYRLPAAMQIHIDFYDLHGRKIQTRKNIQNNSTVNLSGLTAQLYLIRIYSSHGKQLYVGKLIKQ